MKLAKNQIAQQFSRAAATYDSASQLQVEMADRLLQKIPSADGDHWVDLGCGTGYALEQMARLAPRKLTGIDIAPRMIEVAQTRIPTAEFVCGDLENTTLPGGCAEIVFSNAALQWCNSRSALREIKRIARPGGIVLVSTFGPATLNQWRTAWQSVDANSARVHDFESPDELRAKLNELGFEEIQVTVIERNCEFASVSEMFQNIKRMGATNAAANRRKGLLGRRLYQQVVDWFEKEIQQTGKLTCSFECVFVFAKTPRSP